MSKHSVTKKDNSRKRKLVAYEGPPRAERPESNISEDLNQSPFPDPPQAFVNSRAERNGPPQKVILAKRRKEFEKIVAKAITERNYQRDLKTQLELAAIEAQNDDSDDEPMPRHLRTSSHTPAVINQFSVSSHATIELYTKELKIVERAIPELCETRSVINIDRLSKMNPDGENNDGQDQTKRNAYTSTSEYVMEDEELSIRLQRYRNECERNRNTIELGASAQAADTTTEMDFIPLPSTSTNSESALNAINLSIFEASTSSIENSPLPHSDNLQPTAQDNDEAGAGCQHLPPSDNLQPIAQDNDEAGAGCQPLPPSDNLQPIAQDNDEAGAECQVLPPSDGQLPEPQDTQNSVASGPNYVLIEFFQDEESENGTVDILSITGQDFHPQESVNIVHVPEALMDSSDDDDYLQMVQDVQNCYITLDNLRSHRSPRSNMQNRMPGGAGSPRISWRSPRGRQGRHGRVSPQLVAAGPREAHRGMSNEELFPNFYYYLGPNYVFYPVQIQEQPQFIELEEMVFSPPPPIPEVLMPSIGWGPWSRNRPESPELRSNIQRDLPTTSRRPTGRFVAQRIRSASSENIPRMPQPAQPGYDGGEQDIAQAVVQSCQPQAAEGQTKTKSLSALGRSVSIPELNVIGFCPICHKGLNKKEVASTYCGHLFCMDCINRAILINGKRCPTCRHPMLGHGFHAVYF